VIPADAAQLDAIDGIVNMSRSYRWSAPGGAAGHATM